MAYIQGDDIGSEEEAPLRFLPGADPTCFLCQGVVDTRDRERLIVARRKRCVVVLNRFPYNNGHLLVAPQLHKARLDQLDAEEHLEISQEIERMVRVLEEVMKPEGFNIGLNLGRIAGAGLPGHVHWHIVPRWSGDTNFMPALAAVKVIPQALDTLWEVLRRELGTL
jgi:ATP adenylyltransferase